MNQISFTIPGKPISTNDYKAPKIVKTKTKSFPQMYETKAAKDYKKNVINHVRPMAPEIFQFETHYSVHDHALACTVVLWLPDLITKDMRISKRSIDIDNSLKCLLDGMFDCFDKLDDKMICDLFVLKRKGAEFSADITLHKQSFSNIV